MTEEQCQTAADRASGTSNAAIERRLAKLDARAYLAAIVEGLVNDKNQVEVSVSGEGSDLLLAINAPREVRRYIIGRRGRVIESVRDILRSYGACHSLKIEVRVIEDQQGETGNGNGQSKRY